MKEFLFSLGVFFGLITGFDDPSIKALIIRDNTQLVLSAIIENSDHEKIQDMVASGNSLEIRLEVILKDYGAKSFIHEIVYNPIEQNYEIWLSETAETLETQNRGAAFLLWTQFDRLTLWSESELKKGPLVFVITAELDLSESGEADPGVLWNYVTPQKILRYESINEVSY